VEEGGGLFGGGGEPPAGACTGSAQRALGVVFSGLPGGRLGRPDCQKRWPDDACWRGGSSAHL